MSDLLQTSQYSFVVEDLLPNQDYVFQVEIENSLTSAGDSSDSDSMDLDLTNTDLESRMGDTERPASRARSFR